MSDPVKNAMHWEEEGDSHAHATAGDVVDIAFRIQCEAIPVDHAHALGESILAALPWFRGEPRAAVHSLHVADSGNGWMRPQAPDELIFPSRRTRLLLRVPRNRIEETMALTGQALDIDGHALVVGAPATRQLTPFSAIYARYLVADDDGDEEAFLDNIVFQLKALSIQPRKMICGISKTIHTPDDIIPTRSLMLADMGPEDSLLLQQTGLGEHRYLGCGIFIPHKDINKLSDSNVD